MSASRRDSGQPGADGSDRADAPNAADEPDTGERPGRGPLDESLSTEALPASVPCPFCGGVETEQFAAFGSQLSTSQYYCRPCRTVFEYLKWHRS